jgi:hypothetical protein
MPRGRARIEQHGANHSPGGSDPIPGIGSGGDGGGASSIIATWAGTMPSAAGPGVVWIVPDIAGVSGSFTLQSITARLETPGSSATSFTVQTSAGGGAFSASTVGSVTVPAGSYEATTSSLSVGVDSGDLLRILFVGLGSPASLYSVEVEGVVA